MFLVQFQQRDVVQARLLTRWICFNSHSLFLYLPIFIWFSLHFQHMKTAVLVSALLLRLCSGLFHIYQFLYFLTLILICLPIFLMHHIPPCRFRYSGLLSSPMNFIRLSEFCFGNSWEHQYICTYFPLISFFMFWILPAESLFGFRSTEISNYGFTPKKLSVEKSYRVLGLICLSSTVRATHAL